MNALLRWTRRILDLALVLAVLALLLTASLTLGAPAAGARTLVVDGGSMEPTLPQWSYIVAVRQPDASYAVGDIVTVQGPGQTPYTHRVVRLATVSGALHVETKGDANAASDPVLVPITSVVGRVALQLPLLGFLSTLLSIPLGLLGFLLIGGMLLCLIWVIEDLEAGPCPLCIGIAEDPFVPDAGTAQPA